MSADTSILGRALAVSLGAILSTGSCLARETEVPSGGAEVLVNSVNRFLEDPFQVAKLPSNGRRSDAESLRAATCQEVVPDLAKLTLRDAVALGLCNSAQLEAARWAVGVQANSVGESMARYLPNFSYVLSYTRSRTIGSGDGLSLGSSELGSGNLSVSWRLFDFGGRRAHKGLALAALDGAVASHDAMVLTIAEDLTRKYMDVEAQHALLQSAGGSLQRFQAIRASVERRRERGAASGAEVLQAESGVRRAELDEARTLGEYQRALLTLRQSLNLPASEELGVLSTGMAKSAQSQLDLNGWLERAVEKHPMIRRARADVAVAGERVNVGRVEGRPHMDLAANYYQNGRPSQGLSLGQRSEVVVGLNLTIPIFDGFARNYQLKGLMADASQRAALLSDAEREVGLALGRTYMEWQAGVRSASVADAALNSANSLRDAVKRRFDHGLADIVELHNAEASVADSESTRVRIASACELAHALLPIKAGTEWSQLADAWLVGGCN